MKIFIRADGGSSIGLGHVMRMLVLAEELSKKYEVIFICRTSILESKYKAGIDKIKENGYNIFKISEENLVEEIIELQTQHKAQLLITDSYDVNEDYFKKLKPFFNITGYIDDVNNCRMDVDFVINQNMNATDMNYFPNVNASTKLFLGTSYCMLRTEFSEVYKKKQMREEVKDILLTLGGMDKNFNTIKIIQKIKGCSQTIHVVIGSAFDESVRKALSEITKEFNNIILYENAVMSELMGVCDIAIAACGSTLYELCAMGVPTIGIVVADNQELLAVSMKEQGVIIETINSEELESYDVNTLLIRTIEDKKLRQSIIEKQQGLVNVDGANKLMKEIEKLL